MEEEFKPIICIICFNVTTDKNCTVIEESVVNALVVLLLKLPVDEDNKSCICNACCTKVLEAFRFKAVCTDTEQSIVPLFNSKNGAPVDLKEIYLMRKSEQQLRNISEEEKICRLCMQTAIYGFTSVRDIETDVFRIYIPEVNFNYTEEPVLCTTCVKSLKTHSEFLRNCLDPLKFENISKYEPREDQFHIKTEEIEIKSEEIVEHTEIHLTPSEVKMYKCDKCSYKSKYKCRLVSHLIVHKNISEGPIYKCDTCDYKTKYQRCLAPHSLKHKDISEVQTYKCYTCSYKTKHKGDLVTHQLIHKDVSELKMYKCDTCNYKSKRKRNLLVHQLRHKNISEVQMYKCHRCNFETRYKCTLVSHQRVHTDISEAKMYKCDICNFETKYKQTLKRHSLVHIDISRLTNV